MSRPPSETAASAGARRPLAGKPPALLAEGAWLGEGRDIGTVVAPDAAVKVFLTATPRERARRRAAELGTDPRVAQTEHEGRDARDSTRAHSPLVAAPDALVLDTTRLSIEEVVDRVVGLVRAREGAIP